MDACLVNVDVVVMSPADVAMIVDALLQAEATLCEVDDRLVTQHFIERIRAQQLSLADRLDGLISGERSGFATRDFALCIERL